MTHASRSGGGCGCGRWPTQKDVCVDEMVNLTFTPFARTIQRIKKSACQSVFQLVFVGREVAVFSDDVLRDIKAYIGITCIYIYIYWRSNSVI